MKPDRPIISRRTFVFKGAVGAAGLAFTGCARLTSAPTFRELLARSEGLTFRVQRTILWHRPLAREYSVNNISRIFRANGSQDARNLPPEYVRLAEADFEEWRLRVDGLVMKPSTFSLADIRALPARTQITRHDCVEGWSCIGSWTGPQLSTILDQVGLRPEARFIVFHCADELPRYTGGENPYYESIDLIDAYHPQTILAYEMNGSTLPLAHGAPLRLRVERQLGYKMAKFLTRIEAVDRFDTIRGGKGGTWEDDGYEWYAGI
jgi:DMSO/TMAO reductase YedYZ molybdopterin-dependent catalytic subunit